MKQEGPARRILILVTIVLLGVCSLVAPAAAYYDHMACNCWNGDYICTYEDENHEVIGYAFYPEHPGC